MVEQNVGGGTEREARIAAMIQSEIDYCEEVIQWSQSPKEVQKHQRMIEDWKTLLRSAPWAPREFNNANEEKV